MPLYKLFYETLLSIFDNIFYLFSHFVPKSSNIWVFGSMLGVKYADNSKYFFEYVAQYHPAIRPVWITGSRKTASVLAAQGKEVYLFYSLRGIWLSMRAGVGVLSHSVIRDIRPFVLTRKAVLVNLWHGIPLKKIAGDDEVSELRNKRFFSGIQCASRLLCPSFRRPYDLTIACSEEDRRSFSSAFSIPADKIVITGYPRNDALFSSQIADPERAGKKVGIYMPTFRGQEGNRYDFFTQFGFNAQSVNSFLEKLNVHLYLKLHHFNLPDDEIIEAIATSSSISFYDKDDVYEDLSSIDFLVTDYSSIYFDYLLLNRPVIFAPFDHSEYMRSNRRFYYRYNDVTPGPKATDWTEVCHYIKEAVESPESYAQERGMMRSKFHTYCDGNSSERVLREVMKSLDSNC